MVRFADADEGRSSAATRCSSPATSTPTPARTRCRSCTTPATPTSGRTSSPDEHTYLFDGTVGSLDHVLGNAAAMRDGHRRACLEPELGGVGGAGVQPPQLQRDGLLRARPVPRLRPRPAGRRGGPADRCRWPTTTRGVGQPGALAARPAGRDGAGRSSTLRHGRPRDASRCGRQASCWVAARCTTARST